MQDQDSESKDFIFAFRYSCNEKGKKKISKCYFHQYINNRQELPACMTLRHYWTQHISFVTSTIINYDNLLDCV